MTIPLTQPPGSDLNAAMSANPPGMAWIAGTGPEGTTCGGCLFWTARIKPDHHHKSGKLKPAPCERFTKLMRRNAMEVIGDAVEPLTASCRDFIENEKPPVDIPPCIKGSNIRDTIIPGLTVRFKEDGSGTLGTVFHAASGKVVLDGPGGRLRIGRREFVQRVNDSRLREIDWMSPDLAKADPGSNVHIANTAREQIWGRK